MQRSYNKPFLWMICLVAAMAGFLFGYDWIVVGGAKPFYEPFFHIDSPTMKGWGTSSALVGCVLGALLCAIYCDKWGRRPLLIAAGALFFLSSIGTALTDTFASYNVYRIVGGVGIGIALNLSPMYIAEMAPSHMRGKLVSLNQLLIMFGILSAQITNWGISLFDTEMPVNATDEIIRQSWNGQFGWRWMLGVEAIPAFVFFVLMIFMPESVRFLVKCKRSDKAVKILTKLGGEAFAKEKESSIEKTLTSETLSKTDYKELLKPGLFKVLLLAVFLAFLQQWSGMNVILYYAADIFQAAGYNIKEMMLQIVVIGSTMALSVFVTMAVVDRWGRKSLLMFGLAAMAIVYLIEGTLFYLDIKGVYIIILTIVCVAFYSLTLAPLLWIILSEIFPNRIRGVAMSLASVAHWIANFSLTFTFPAIKEYLGWTLNFWLYALICLIGLIVVKRKLPETKGKSLEEIEDLITH